MNAGYKTGLFTSPFLLNFTERIEICGLEISEDELDLYSKIVFEKIEDMRTLYDVTYNPEMKNPKDEINRSKMEQEERAEKIEKQLMEDYDNFFKIN